MFKKQTSSFASTNASFSDLLQNELPSKRLRSEQVLVRTPSPCSSTRSHSPPESFQTAVLRHPLAVERQLTPKYSSTAMRPQQTCPSEGFECDPQLPHVCGDPLKHVIIHNKQLLCQNEAVPKNETKTFVFDTSSLLNARFSVLSFLSTTNSIVIPFVVIQELDNLAVSFTSVHRDAIDRQTERAKQLSLKVRDWLLAAGEKIHIQSREEVDHSISSSVRVNDDRILQCTLYFQKSRGNTTLVTEDKTLKLKCFTERVQCQTFEEVAEKYLFKT